MFRTKNVLPVLFLLFIIIMFFVWNMLFEGQEGMRITGISAIQVFVGMVSFIWLFQAYMRRKDRFRKFWLLLSLGLLNIVIGNLVWLLAHTSQNSLLSAEAASFFWVVSYVFFLTALIYKTKRIGIDFSNKTWLFNIVIYMATAVAISTYFLIKPVLLIPEISTAITVFTIGFQLADLGILFLIIVLYYLIRFKKEHKHLLFLIAGFFLHLTADSLFAYLSIKDAYQAGSFIDFMWMMAVILIGLSGYYSKETDAQESGGIVNRFDRKEFYFPYISMLLLTVLVIFSYQWHLNALSIGLLITFLMVLGRQIFILAKNDKLMGELRDLAYYDPLTGLPNRFGFIEDISMIMRNTRNCKATLLLINLDRFKVVNDTLGHPIGDLILVEVAGRLKRFLNTDARIYRLGGDEFVVILPVASEAKAVVSAKAILTSFQKPFVVLAYEVNLTPSIGISIFPEHGKTYEELLKNADAAMYLSKENGKNNFTFFNVELYSCQARKMKIENDLKRAIYKKQLSLVYQPKIDLQTEEIIGMEALLRWEHPELGWISPVEFISIAEETGFIVPIGEWVLETACKQNRSWQEQGLPSLCISVNVSVLQFKSRDFTNTVKRVLSESMLAPQFLELEITESIMQNTEESIEILGHLKELGVKISIDDFGTGYSSLHVLQKLPIDTLKIDKLFIDELDQDGGFSMIETIIGLGLSLNLCIVSEGIETEDQLAFLQKSGCMIGQGYLFSRPLNAVKFEKLIRNGIVIGFKERQLLLTAKV